MATIIDAVLRLKDEFTAKLTAATGKLDEHEKAQKRVSKSIAETGKNITAFGGKVALLAAPLETVALAGAKLHSQFAAGMTKVSTLVDTTVVNMKALEQGVREVSDATGVSVTDLAESEYQAISAGVDAAHVTEFLNTVTKASIAGYTDSTTAINGVTTVLNSYGMATQEASKITDEMLITQNLGKTSFGELAQSIGNVTPIAKTLGVTTEELFGSLAALTKNGIATSEAVTGMKAACSNIMKPSSEAGKMAQQLGLDFSAAHLKSVGWAKFLDEVKEKTNGDTTAMTALFGSVEAANSIFSLTGAGAKDFKDALAAMSDQAGITDEVFQKIVQNDPTRAMQIVKNQLENIGMDLGTSLAPYINRAAVELKQLAKVLNSMTPEQRDLVMTIGQSVIMFGLLTAGLGKAVTMYASARTGILSFVKVAKEVKDVGVGGVLVKQLPMLKAFGAGAEAAAGKTSIFKRALVKLGTGINGIFSALLSPVATFRKGYTAALEAVGRSIASFFSRVIRVPGMIGGVIVRGLNALAQIPGRISGVFRALTTVIRNPIGAFRSLFSVIRMGFTAMRALMAANPVGLALLALTVVIGYVIKHWKTFQQVISTVWEHVSGTISGAIARISPIFSQLWQAIKGAFDKIVDALGLGEMKTEECGDTMTVVVNTLGSAFSAAFDIMAIVVETAVDIIAGALTTAINVASDLISFIVNVFTGNWQGAWDNVKQIFSDIWDGIVSTFNNVMNTLSAGLDRILGKAHDAKEASAEAESSDGGEDGNWTGTNYFPGGVTWLHEQGPELVYLPTGARVVPHSDSLKEEYQRGLETGSQMMRPVSMQAAPATVEQRTGDIRITIPKLANQIVVREKQDIDNLANALVFKMKQYALNSMAGAVI